MSLETALFDGFGNRKYLNAKERQRFYEVATKITDPHQRAFVLTLFYTGARISEVLYLKGNNIDLQEGFIVFRTLKQRSSSRFRAVPIPSELSELLRKPASENKRVWAFCRTTGWKRVKNCMLQADIVGVKASPKGLRHGFAVACITKEIPVSMVRKWMGHARLESTTVYLDLVGDEERDLVSRIWD